MRPQAGRLRELGVLSYFPMPEGRVVNIAGTLTQEFIITDQQGNARVSFNNSGTGGTAKVVQENSYYGTGLAMTPLATGTNKKLYNGGSEWQNDYNKLPDYYQTFYRNYDAAIARFVGVDPEAESAESMTTYQYAGNNPIMGNDPMGNINPRLPQPPPVVSGELSGMDAIAAENQGAEDAEAWLNYNSGGDAASMGSSLANGGADQGYMAGSYVNNIGRNTNPANWQNVGAFDDDGAYSVDGGAAQDAFYQGLDPGHSYHYQTYEYYDNGSETNNDPTGSKNSTPLDQVDIRLITGQSLVADDANQGGWPFTAKSDPASWIFRTDRTNENVQSAGVTGIEFSRHDIRYNIRSDELTIVAIHIRLPTLYFEYPRITSIFGIKNEIIDASWAALVMARATDRAINQLTDWVDSQENPTEWGTKIQFMKYLEGQVLKDFGRVTPVQNYSPVIVSPYKTL